MSKADTYPRCFDSLSEYRGWRTLAVTAHEAATPCTDCTARYKATMAEEARCYPNEMRINFYIATPKTAWQKQIANRLPLDNSPTLLETT